MPPFLPGWCAFNTSEVADTSPLILRSQRNRWRKCQPSYCPCPTKESSSSTPQTRWVSVAASPITHTAKLCLKNKTALRRSWFDRENQYTNKTHSSERIRKVNNRPAFKNNPMQKTWCIGANSVRIIIGLISHVCRTQRHLSEVSTPQKFCESPWRSLISDRRWLNTLQ